MYSERYRTHHDASRQLKDSYKLDIDKDNYVLKTLNQSAIRDRVLYIHVPYCNKICSFCPFHRPDRVKRDDYYKLIIEELEYIASFPYAKKPLKAINFGGGTPTAIRPIHMDMILKTLKRLFIYDEDIEISVETSITELSKDMIKALKDGGVNRLSIGVQTFDDEGRKLLNRRGSGQRAIDKIKELKEYGFENINIDLIYNYPHQTIESLKRDIEIIKSLKLAGISFYSLMIHEKTPIAKLITDDDRKAMNDKKREFEMFKTIVLELEKDGFMPFEFTKLIRNNLDRYLYMDVRHNQGDCIAIGLGAGGNIGNYIYHNKEGFKKLEKAQISAMGRIEDDYYFKLDELVHNLERGSFTFTKYNKLLNLNLKDKWDVALKRLEEEKLIELKDDKIIFTLLGMFYGNNIIDELIGILIK